MNEAFLTCRCGFRWLKEATQIVLRVEIGGWFGVKSGKRTEAGVSRRTIAPGTWSILGWILTSGAPLEVVVAPISSFCQFHRKKVTWI